MIEDNIYRTSSQYRIWSFTTESLASLRASTNALAAERVRAALKRARTSQRENGDLMEDVAAAEGGEEPTIDCLTVDEELKLVRYYCEKLMELGDAYKLSLPTSLRATAIQYLRRFYLTNSPMTYHPKNIMLTALFLATKTDNYFIPLSSFAEQIPNTTPDDIVAPEFLLTQGLRFTFDVRHPFRGLEGGIMELLAIAEGQGDAGPGRSQTPAELQSQLSKIKPAPATITTRNGRSPNIKTRIAEAHTATKEILKTAALMTDAYFLYTPSQIWLSAFLLSDEPLAIFYIDIKIPPPPLTSTTTTDLRPKLLSILSSCKSLLQSHTAIATSESEQAALMKEMKRIGKKLYHCQNPEKVDLVSLNRAQKRDAEAELEAVRKKRRLERERAEKEAEGVFGAAIIKKESE